MDNFDFSDRIITIIEWNAFNQGNEINEIQARVLVLSADSPTGLLNGPLNKLNRIVVTSVDFNDGRIFSIGRQIRLLGYIGSLTVVGDLLPDQFPALLSCGFDKAVILENFNTSQTLEIDQAFDLFEAGDSGTGKMNFNQRLP